HHALVAGRRSKGQLLRRVGSNDGQLGVFRLRRELGRGRGGCRIHRCSGRRASCCQFCCGAQRGGGRAADRENVTPVNCGLSTELGHLFTSRGFSPHSS